MNSSDPLLDATIYIIDDDQPNRELLEARLQHAGFRNLTLGKNGLEAVELVDRQAPDIMLLDVMMPGMDGYQVIRHVRTSCPDQFVPIILLSAAGEPEQRVRGIDAGANDFLSKPYNAEELVARVRSLLAHKQAVDQLNRERARMSALLNQVGNPVIVTDTAGMVAQVNPAAQEALGLDEAVLGAGLGELFGLGVEDLLVRAQERGAPVSGVHTLRNGWGDQRLTFNVSVSPIQGVGYILFWQDITALQEGERARLDVEKSHTRHVLETFSHYMNPALVERVLQDPDIMDRSDKREATVLFADLRGFTHLTTRQAPDKVMQLLNEVFTDMLDVVNSHEGLVMDIVGDELMVAFNVPYPQDNPVQRAIDMAVEMQRQFNRLRTARHDRDMEVGLGIGINSGPVVMGHIGGRSHKSYTLVGETVNVAHRMVDVAEDGQIVTSVEFVRIWQPQDGRLQVSELDISELKGVPDPVALAVIEVME